MIFKRSTKYLHSEKNKLNAQRLRQSLRISGQNYGTLNEKLNERNVIVRSSIAVFRTLKTSGSYYKALPNCFTVASSLTMEKLVERIETKGQNGGGNGAIQTDKCRPGYSLETKKRVDTPEIQNVTISSKMNLQNFIFRMLRHVVKRGCKVTYKLFLKTANV